MMRWFRPWYGIDMAKAGTEWTPLQVTLLRLNFPNKKASELAAIIGRDEVSIAHKAHKLKLKKSPEFYASESSGRLKESPIGKEYINSHGYRVRKINNDADYYVRWKEVHIIEWEEHHGPVPEGFMVTFKDGDKTNTDISNLELLTHHEMYLRNTIHRYPNEVKALIRLQRKLERTIKRSEENA